MKRNFIFVMSLITSILCIQNADAQIGQNLKKLGKQLSDKVTGSEGTKSTDKPVATDSKNSALSVESGNGKKV